MDALRIRPAGPDDLEAVAAIYDHYVLHSTCTFATEPEGPEHWRGWLAEHEGLYPALVAEAPDAGVIGWCTASPWNPRCAYRYTAESSVYVAAGRERRGAGRALMEQLIATARELGHHSLVAQIADHQAPSEGLHAVLGFTRVGVLEQVGFKFDRWIDVALWQRRL